MDCLEDITTRMHDGYYVDLFVRASNKTAVQMYTKVRKAVHHVIVALLIHFPPQQACVTPKRAYSSASFTM